MKRTLREAVYGNLATVFHRSKTGYYASAFFLKNLEYGKGAGSMYGPGIYTVYNLKSTTDNTYAKAYGDIIYKFKADMSNMFFFNYNQFAKISWARDNKATPNNFIELQLKRFGMEVDGKWLEKFKKKDDNRDLEYQEHTQFSLEDVVTSQAAESFYNYIDVEYGYKDDLLNAPCNGIIFTGKSDGDVAVFWRPYVLVPISLSHDEGATWHEIKDKKIPPMIMKNGMLQFDHESGELVISPTWRKYVSAAAAEGKKAPLVGTPEKANRNNRIEFFKDKKNIKDKDIQHFNMLERLKDKKIIVDFDMDDDKKWTLEVDKLPYSYSHSNWIYSMLTDYKYDDNAIAIKEIIGTVNAMDLNDTNSGNLINALPRITGILNIMDSSLSLSTSLIERFDRVHFIDRNKISIDNLTGDENITWTGPHYCKFATKEMEEFFIDHYKIT